MTFITFIYRIKNSKKTFYGKFITDYVSDDHEGLDLEVKRYLISGINAYRKQKNQNALTESQIFIGIMSFSSSSYIPLFSSDEEVKCFDCYVVQNPGIKTDIYINSKLMEK
jgi:hypothetical protein